MKKLIIFFILFLIFSVASSQHQRMQIQAQEIDLEIGKSETVKADCIDFFRARPKTDTKLNFILGDPNSAKVYVNGSNKPEKLAEYLNSKNIEIEGLNSYSEVRFVNNNPDKSFRIDLGGPIQVSEYDEAEKILYGNNRNEIWKNDVLSTKRDLDLIDYRIDTEEFILRFSDNRQGELQKRRVEAFMKDNELDDFREFNERLKKEVEKVNQLKSIKLELSAKQLEESKSMLFTLFEKYDIGIYNNKHSLKELVKKYGEAREADFSLNNTDKINQITQNLSGDYRNGIYYKWNEAENKYNTYHIHKKLPNILILKTEYYSKYQEELIDNIFSRKISRDNVHIVNLFGKKGFFNEGNLAIAEQIEKLFPTNHSHFEIEELPRLANVIKNTEIEYLVIFSHFGKNVICPNEACMPPYSIDAVSRMLKGTGIELILIGCKSSIYSSGHTGTTHIVNTTPMLNSLHEALEMTNNFGDFQKSMAAGSNKEFLFTIRFDEKEGLVIFESKARVSDSRGRQGNNKNTSTLSEDDPIQTFEIRMPIHLFNKTIEDDNEKRDQRRI